MLFHIATRSAPSQGSFRTSRALTLRRALRRFQDEAGGSVAVMFAVMLLVLCLFVGAAVDLGRWAQARHQTLVAMDAAVLAGGRVLQLNEDDVNVAQQVALQYYVENTRGRAPVVEDTITFSPVDDNTAFTASGNAFIETSFLSLAKIPRLPLFNETAAAYPKADLKSGGANNHPVEISVMLDVTGSMAGTKITDLKAAATDLVNIVISDSPLAKPTRVALVPFADAVRLPETSVSEAVGSPHKIVRKTTGSGNNQRARLFNRSEHCVVERTGNDRYTDTAPGPGNYVMPLRAEVAAIPASQGTVLIDGKSNTTQGAKATVQWKSGANLSQSQKNALVNAANSFAPCPVSAKSEVVPLTNDKTLLRDRIDGLELATYTAGQLGTAWVWYTLSPNWNSLWPTANAASAYSSDMEKIAILMTDGEYNQEHDSSGIATRATGSGSAANGTSVSQARSLCTAMKERGITIYTVGFALGKNSTAVQTLNHCATDASKAYVADSGSQLKQAFRDIALKISNLHLTQ